MRELATLEYPQLGNRENFVGASLTEVMIALKSENLKHRLLSLNWILAIAHFLAGVVFGVIFASRLPCGEDQIPTTIYDHTDAGFASPTFTVTVQRVAIATVAFFFITAGFHFAYALNSRGWYTRSIGLGLRTRWIEYSISATIMIGIIATVTGVRDANTFYGLLFATIAIMMTGAWWEATRDVTAIFTGFLLLGWVFIAIVRSFMARMDEAAREGVEVPGFVFGILAVTLLFYSSFGAVPVCQWLWPKLVTPARAEFVYVLLSAISKLTLASLLAWGLVARSSRSEQRKRKYYHR